MAGVAFAFVVLRHERQSTALLRRDLLGTILVDDVVVARRHCVAVLERDLVLAEVALPLGRLDLHPGVPHAEPDRPKHRFDAARAEDGVVDVVLVGRYEIVVVLVGRRLVSFVEQDELEFRADVGGPAKGGESFDLALQDLPRRFGDGCAVEPLGVGQQQRGPRLPWHSPQGRQVGRHHQVAVAAIPGGDAVSVHGVHLDVYREEIIAALGAMVEDVAQEMRGVHSLALQTPLHVGDGNDDCVDQVVLNSSAKFVEAQR